MYKYEKTKPQKICIYKGVFPSGEIRFFMQMLKGCLTTINLEYMDNGKLSLYLMPLVEPLYWTRLTKDEFFDQCLKWGKKLTDFEEDFIDEFQDLPLYLKGLDRCPDGGSRHV